MEKNLQIRPGTRTMVQLEEGAPVRGLWAGYVQGAHVLLAACGGHVWKLDVRTDENGEPAWEKQELGTVADRETHFFGFGDAVYLLNGAEYKTWDGTGTLRDVEGYVPIVVTAADPAGGGTELEQINRLTGKRRQQFSADGTARTFQLAETGLSAVLSATVDGAEAEGWTANAAAGTVTFAAAPGKGVNNVCVTYDTGTDFADEVRRMRFSETYNGTTDSRLFLYGDGSNRLFYSGLDENGTPRADYFPAMNELAVDTENTPVTGLVKHYDRLIVYKRDGTWAISYQAMTGEDGAAIAGFTVIPINREIGNQPMGQVRLVYNNPRSLTEAAIYEWKLYSGSVRDERNASRISDRVGAQLRSMDLSAVITFDDERNYEYWVASGGTAVIHNYATDLWYRYTDLPATCFVSYDNEVYFGGPDGRVRHISRSYRSDDGVPIDAYWESGSMSFDVDYRRKYSSLLFVTLKPESNARLFVTAQSNRKSEYPDKLVSSSLSTLLNLDFEHWSFGTNRKPDPVRVKLKVKKFAFYKLVFHSNSASSTATVMSVSMVVRYTGYVK